jgi:hypothetical protein
LKILLRSIATNKPTQDARPEPITTNCSTVPLSGTIPTAPKIRRTTREVATPTRIATKREIMSEAPDLPDTVLYTNIIKKSKGERK